MSIYEVLEVAPGLSLYINQQGRKGRTSDSFDRQVSAAALLDLRHLVPRTLATSPTTAKSATVAAFNLRDTHIKRFKRVPRHAHLVLLTVL